MFKRKLIQPVLDPCGVALPTGEDRSNVGIVAKFSLTRGTAIGGNTTDAISCEAQCSVERGVICDVVGVVKAPDRNVARPAVRNGMRKIAVRDGAVVQYCAAVR